MTRDGCIAWIMLCVCLWACAPRTSAPVAVPMPEPIRCDSISAVNSYVDRVTVETFEEFVTELSPPAAERATVSVRIDDDGSLISANVINSSSVQAEAHARRAVKSAAPYPPPPRAHLECLVRKPLLIMLQADLPIRCDAIPEVERYVKSVLLDVERSLYDAKYRYAPGRGRVRLNLLLGRDGGVRKIDILRSASTAASEKLASAIDECSPFEPPPEFTGCFFTEPIRMWMDVPGYDETSDLSEEIGY